MQAQNCVQARALIERINSLREPYRQNVIDWLELATRRRIFDVSEDLIHFLEGLNPVVRERFVLNTRMILDDANRYFGKDSQTTCMEPGLEPSANAT